MHLTEKAKAVYDIARVRQWYKNILVLAPLVFARLLVVPDAFINAVGAAIVFCLISSCMYVVNDLIDEEHDRNHPQKKNRPLPSGKIKRYEAICILAFMGFLAIVLSLKFNELFMLTALSYVILTVLYSLFLKQFFLVDVFSIGLGFILRVFAGCVVLGVSLSPWLFVATFLLALILGFSKRAAELTLPDHTSRRKVLDSYNILMLRSFTVISTTCVMIIYLIYAVTVVTDHLFVMTSIFVLYGCFRFLSMSIERGKDPEEMFNDKPFFTSVFLWVVSVVIILYGFR